jgi:membrane-associated protein
MSVDTLTHLLITYKYILLLPLAIIEGPVLALIVGIIVKLGYLNFYAAFIVMILGDFLPDTFYYHLGRHSNNWNFAQKIMKKLDNTSVIEKAWKRHMVKTLFVSKLAMGIAPALLMTAGRAEVPYRKYIGLALLITITQYGFFIFCGYTIGYSYNLISDFKYFGMFVAAFVIILVIIHKSLRRFANKELKEIEKESYK